MYYNQRTLYYWSKLYTCQLKEGDAFSELKKTVCINVLNFNYFDEEPKYHNVFKLLHVESHKNYFEDMELHFIELNKCNDDLTKIKTTLDRWVNFLRKANEYDKTTFPQVLKQEPAIEKAFLRLNTLFFNEEEREIYEARLKWLRDEAAALQKAHEKGRMEEKHEVAKMLLKHGVELTTIAASTHLTLDECDAIQYMIRE